MAALKHRNHRDSRPRSGMRGDPAPLQPIFSARVEPDVKEKAEIWIKESGWTKRQLVEFALEEVFEKLSSEDAREMKFDLAHR